MRARVKKRRAGVVIEDLPSLWYNSKSSFIYLSVLLLSAFTLSSLLIVLVECFRS